MRLTCDFPFSVADVEAVFYTYSVPSRYHVAIKKNDGFHPDASQSVQYDQNSQDQPEASKQTRNVFRRKAQKGFLRPSVERVQTFQYRQDARLPGHGRAAGWFNQHHMDAKMGQFDSHSAASRLECKFSGCVCSSSQSGDAAAELGQLLHLALDPLFGVDVARGAGGERTAAVISSAAGTA